MVEIDEGAVNIFALALDAHVEMQQVVALTTIDKGVKEFTRLTAANAEQYKQVKRDPMPVLPLMHK